MINLSELNSFPAQDGGSLAMLKEIAQRYCPEELQAERKAILPDEQLNLSELEAGFRQLLAGGSGYGELPYLGDTDAQTKTIPHEDGFGIGIPETQKLRNLHYEEADTLNSEQIKKDFPILKQKVNGHDLVWLDNGATTQKPNQVIDKISDYYRTYNSNIHRGAHTLAARATDAYEEAREKVQRFINAATSEEIIFVRGTTEGINLVAQTYGRQFLTPGGSGTWCYTASNPYGSEWRPHPLRTGTTHHASNPFRQCGSCQQYFRHYQRCATYHRHRPLTPDSRAD